MQRILALRRLGGKMFIANPWSNSLDPFYIADHRNPRAPTT